MAFNKVTVYLIIAILVVLTDTSYCAVVDNAGIGILKWTDGIIAVLFGTLWMVRQMLLTLMYNGAYLGNVKLLYYIMYTISVVIPICMVSFVVTTSVLSFPTDTVYSNTINVLVGFVISIVLDKRKQFSLSGRIGMISQMLAKDKFRIGNLDLHDSQQKEIGLFKVSKQKIPEEAEVGARWSGIKYTIDNKFYIQDWGIEHRIYGMDSEQFAEYMGKYGKWIDSLLEASLSIGWLPSYYINHTLLTYLVQYAKDKKSIKSSLRTWKRQVVGLQEEDIDKILNKIDVNTIGSSSNASTYDIPTSRIILGLYALALMEQRDASKWLSKWEKALQYQYDNDYRYSDSYGNIIMLDSKPTV